MSTGNEVYPVLETGRLTLADVDYSHAADLLRLYTDERVTKYYPVYPFRTEHDLYPIIESFKTRQRSGTGIRWGISLQGHADIIGTIGYKHIEPGHKGTLMFALMPEHQNKGYVTEALSAVLRYGFETLDLKRIEAEVMPGNAASDAVLIKAGFTFEGLLRNWMMWEHKLYDMNMYAKITGRQSTP